MGIVKANFVCIDKKDRQLWVERGFEECQDFPSFFALHEGKETVMLGVPKTIVEFGIDNFIGAKVLEVSTHLGTYGMGGPGFFGLLCETRSGDFWLTMAVWAASEYIFIDERIVECHPKYDKQYNPWHTETSDIVDFMLKGATIKNLTLSETECRISLKTSNCIEHEMLICKFNENQPPMGNGDARKNAFEEGILSDYLLVTYKDTDLEV